MKYRTEIDGLRAVAVLLVVLFHADSRICSGGYVGVDVFFVISGYLITSIISREVEQGKFSLIRFYERRARRILPAYFVTVLFVLSASWCLVLPSAFKAVGRAVAASTLSLSNVLFWAEDGYFAAASEEKPLLHTWSLGVEEQFYLILPVLFLLARLRRRSTLIMSMCLSASFFTSLVFLRTSPSSSFFLLPARAWELLIGSLLSTISAKDSISTRFGTWISTAGIVTILSTAWGYTVGTAFPGENALLPCIGAAAVIYGGREGFVRRVLSTGPLVFLGKIS